ncbi:MAG: putative lyase [bacterium ADurb.Bin429]|nr:MAG: putative lyase [bacterium ADurb.Bin429]
MSISHNLGAITSENWQVRAEACARLGASSDPAALPALLSLLLDENAHVREAVWTALGRMGAPAVEPLLASTAHESPEMRQSVCQALGFVRDARAVDALLARLADENILVRQAACVGLARQGDPQAVPALLEQLRHPRTAVRIAACRALGTLRDPRAKGALLALLGDDDAQVRQAASMALEGVGEGALGRTVLQALQGDPMALEALAERARTDAGWLIPLLASHLDDANARVRLAACATLGCIGPACLDAVIALLGRPEAEVRRMVLQVLREVNHPGAVPLLVAKLDDADWRIRQSALAALTALGPLAAEPLLRYLDAPEVSARLAACQILGMLRDARAFPGLLARLGDDNEQVRTAACEALGQFGDQRAVADLLACVKDTHQPVRTAACRALRMLKAVQATDILMSMVYDNTPESRELAFDTLLEMKEVLEPCAHSFYCEACLARFIWKRAEVRGMGQAPYLVCRQCGKSAYALSDVNLVVAVLDHTLREPYRMDGTTARIHALAREDLFDFDAVEILRATDYEVERFCMRVGNDLDDERVRRYRQLLCQVWNHAALSESTVNVLRSMFGRVICEE